MGSFVFIFGIFTSGLKGIATKLRFIVTDPENDCICDSSVVDVFNAGNMNW